MSTVGPAPLASSAAASIGGSGQAAAALLKAAAGGAEGAEPAKRIGAGRPALAGGGASVRAVAEWTTEQACHSAADLQQ